MMTPILANGDGGFDVIILGLFIGFGSLWLLPVSSAVNWLRGKRIVAAVGLALAATLGLGLLVDTENLWIDRVVLGSIPFALAAAFIMFRRARPGSYWYRNWYSTARQEKALWTYNTRDGRRRHKQTLAIAAGSVVLAVVAAPIILSAVDDFLTTTPDETQIELTLSLTGEPEDALGTMDLADGEFVIASQMSGKTMDLGPDLTNLIMDPLVGGCMFYESTHQVSITVTPRSDEAAREVLDRVTPDEDLILARTERELLVDPLQLIDTLEAENFADCERSTVRAFLDPAASDAQRRQLADAVRTWPGVIAVAQPIWPYERRGYAQYPELAVCFGPVDLAVVFRSNTDPMGTELASRLEAESIVERAFAAWDPDAEEGEGEAEVFHGRHPTQPDCEDHRVIVHLEAGTSDPDSALVLAALLGTPGVAGADLYRYAWSDDHGECLEDAECIEEVTIDAMLGDTKPETLDAVAEAVCHLAGVVEVNNVKSGALSPECTPPRIEVRSDTKEGWEAVLGLLSARDDLVREVQESEPLVRDDSTYVTYGDLDPAVCDCRAGDLTYRVEARLADSDQSQMTALVQQIEATPGVVQVLGSVVGRMTEDPRLCGYPMVRFAVGEPFLGVTQDGFVDSVLSHSEVRGVDTLMGDAFHADIGLDEGAPPIGGGGTIYLHEFDLDVARELVNSLGTWPGIVHMEVAEP